MSSLNYWSCLDSDPALFGQYVCGLRARGEVVEDVSFEDVWEMPLGEEQGLRTRALIFLYEINGKTRVREQQLVEGGGAYPRCVSSEEAKNSGITFIPQTIHNACGAVALAHALANWKEQPSLRRINSKQNYDQNSQSFHQVFGPIHSDLVKQYRLERVDKDHSMSAAQKEIKKEEVVAESETCEKVMTHFITILPKAGFLWELDGRLPGPINHGPIQQGELWTHKATRVMQDIIALDPDNSQYNAIAMTTTTHF